VRPGALPGGVFAGADKTSLAALGPSALLRAPPAENVGGMRGSVQNGLRLFTRIMRPLALRSAGKEGSSTSVVGHVGRRSGRTYQTPVVTAQHDDSFLIALPYGKRTDWLKNVLNRGSATIVTNGHTYEVDRPEVIPMAEATCYFRPREQRMHRQFHVDTALRVRQRREAHR
jgi:deazaflavin-dependent oxidoreductase (nitroreductase family)